MEVLDSNVDVNAVDFTYPFLKGIDPKAPPATLTIPNKYLDAMANMERQYWEIKAKHYNVVVFFKKGKFYELYDYDAIIANREFGLKLVFDTTNRGKMRLAGVPEQSLSEWARLFVFRGYKVGRVEEMKDNKDDASGIKQKIVPRELITVLTPGTIKDPAMLSDHGALFVLALCPVIGDCGEIAIDAFAVDLSRRVALRCKCFSHYYATKLEPPNARDNGFPPCKREKGVMPALRDTTLRTLTALLQQLNPKEVLVPDSTWTTQCNAEDQQMLNNIALKVAKWVESEGCTVEAIPNALSKRTDAGASAAESLMTSYFTSLRLDADIALFSEATDYDSHLTCLPKEQQQEEGSVSSASAGALNRASTKNSSVFDYERRFDRGLILDAATVSNLEVLTNLHDGTEKHSLNECLNHCSTNGGRRLFRSWLLRPSASARVIEARQTATRFLAQCNLTHSLSAVEESEELGEKRSRPGESPNLFSSVVTVDFERFLSRLSDVKQNNDAISYVDPMVQYKKNLGIILSCVQALSAMVGWGQQLLARCREAASQHNIDVPPLLEEHLESIVAAAKSTQVIEGLFDRQAAEEAGLLVPSPGTSAAYDAATTQLKQIETKLHEVRRQLQHDVFNGAPTQFSDLGKDLFLVEVSVANAPRMTPRGMVERARNSKSAKYVVSSIEGLVAAHKEAATAKSSALFTVLCSVASRICDEFPRLFIASSALSYVDCLLNLARLHDAFPAACYPAIRTTDVSGASASLGKEAASSQAGAGALIRGCDLVHPLLATKNAVPNSVSLDSGEGRVLLLTGPNMAGKSTLMRTVAINVLLAQLGGPVVATKMDLAPVDRIFTRIGARDASDKGQSTLYVELSETADILRSATTRSLCLIDELGRGTSTHDGMAIAYATLHALTETKPAAPLTIFSTHYHALAMEQARTSGGDAGAGAVDVPLVQLGYMDFVLKAEPVATGANFCDDDTSRSCPPPSALASVVFLYRLVRGICARSYGVEVALMAGIPASLVQLAKKKSEALSRDTAFHEDLHSLSKLLL